MFTHRDLDGLYNRLLGPAVLQSIDPNDNSRSRHQYTCCNHTLMTRVLPPDRDTWRDPETGKFSRRPPLWQPVEGDTWCDWSLLSEWYQSHDMPHPWSAGGAAAIHGDARDMLTMRSRIEVECTDWPQMMPCPHCHDWIVWAEAAYVTGYRICRGCHRHWRLDLDDRRQGHWTFLRAKGRGWPYGAIII